MNLKESSEKILNKPFKHRQNKANEELSVDTSVEYVEELENERLKLRIGNDFLERLLIEFRGGSKRENSSHN